MAWDHDTTGMLSTIPCTIKQGSNRNPTLLNCFHARRADVHDILTLRILAVGPMKTQPEAEQRLIKHEHLHIYILDGEENINNVAIL